MDPVLPGDDIDDVSFAEWLTGESHFARAAEHKRHGYAVDVRPKAKPKQAKSARQGTAPRGVHLNRNRRAGSFDSARPGASGTSSSRTSRSDANASAALAAARAPSAGSRTSGHSSSRPRAHGSMFHWMLCLRPRETVEASEVRDDDDVSLRPAEDEPTPTSKRASTPMGTPVSMSRIRPVITTSLQRQPTLDSLARIDSISENDVEATAIRPSTPPRISWSDRTPSAFLNDALPFDPPTARRTATHALSSRSTTHTASSHAPRRNSIG